MALRSILSHDLLKFRLVWAMVKFLYERSSFLQYPVQKLCHGTDRAPIGHPIVWK